MKFLPKVCPMIGKNVMCMAAAALLWGLGGCASSRHVPKGRLLLDNAVIVADTVADGARPSQYGSYLRQQPNHKMLWALKFRLGLYNLSGADSTKWWNKMWRRLGEAPTVYDPALTAQSVAQMRKALMNKGYLSAEVEVDSMVNVKKRKIDLRYILHPGPRHRISKFTVDIPDTAIRSIVMADSMHFAVRVGDPLDRALITAQREAVTARLRNHGYHNFVKENISFTADTTESSREAALTMTVHPPYPIINEGDTIRREHQKYTIRNVVYITDYDPVRYRNPESMPGADMVRYDDLRIFYGAHRYLRPEVLAENCFLRPGDTFSDRSVERTYKALSRLEILKFINIRFNDIPTPEPGTDMLDVYILLTPGKSQNISLELEGTNSEGDLGVAAGATYEHTNIGKGSETLTAKVRGAYESLSGNLEGLLQDRYMEYSTDLSLRVPKFQFPLLSSQFKRQINATTGVEVSANYQERPEYTRIIASAGWNYRWTERLTRNRHTLTPIDINYVYLPGRTNDFLSQIAPDNPLLRYSYEDHFIMRLGYSFYHSNKRTDTPWQRAAQSDIYTIRVNAETAGNALYAYSRLTDPQRDVESNPYKIFGINYAQYIKVDGDFGYLKVLNPRNSLAYRVGVGVGYPYGNSGILPFEKRFYGGGANGVRGWDVRTLGPGSYPGTNSVSDFIHQCGDIRLDLSAEYRAKLFWVVELGLFVDAGNIWTIRDYPSQPGGEFRFDTFYKQIAAAYGAGLRLDFSFFLLRFDLGMKAHNPVLGAEPWPLIHPDWRRDSSFHFSIGYPF